MKPVLFFLLIFSLFSPIASHAQLATVRDADGWTNVRKGASGDSEIIAKVFEKSVFFVADWVVSDDESWVGVAVPRNPYMLGRSDEELIYGFIHRSRLVRLEELEDPDAEEIALEVVSEPFDPNDRIQVIPSRSGPTMIDDRPAWGTDGGVPRQQVASITITVEGKEQELHEVFFHDLFECCYRPSFKRWGDHYYITAGGSDGGGAYLVCWVITPTGVTQRFLFRDF